MTPFKLFCCLTYVLDKLLLKTNKGSTLMNQWLTSAFTLHVSAFVGSCFL